jgi:hypothetical protein
VFGARKLTHVGAQARRGRAPGDFRGEAGDRCSNGCAMALSRTPRRPPGLLWWHDGGKHPDQTDLLDHRRRHQCAGIARDAAGRGLSDPLVEQGDLGQRHQSRRGSKLIHGGLRYSSTTSSAACARRSRSAEVHVEAGAPPHPPAHVSSCPMTRPLRPRVDDQGRPLALRSPSAGTSRCPGSKALDFPHMEFSAGLKPDIRTGYLYSDCRVDDARLTVLNAMSARGKGATSSRAPDSNPPAAWTACGRRWSSPWAPSREPFRAARHREHRGPLGRRRAGPHRGRQHHGEGAPGEGQPHRRAQGPLAGSRVHPAEPRQARRVRDPVRDELQPHRDHRRAGLEHRRGREDQRRRGGIPGRRGQPVPRQAGDEGGRRVELCGRAPALR